MRKVMTLYTSTPILPILALIDPFIWTLVCNKWAGNFSSILMNRWWKWKTLNLDNSTSNFFYLASISLEKTHHWIFLYKQSNMMSNFPNQRQLVFFCKTKIWLKSVMTSFPLLVDAVYLWIAKVQHVFQNFCSYIIFLKKNESTW